MGVPRSVAAAVRRVIGDSGRSLSSVELAHLSLALAVARRLDVLAGDPECDPRELGALADRVSSLLGRAGVSGGVGGGDGSHGHLFTDPPR